MELSVTEASIEGMRVVKRMPGVVGVWAGVYCLGLFIAIFLAFMVIGAPLFSLAAAWPNVPMDDNMAEQMVNALILGVGIIAPVLTLMSAILAAAIYRAVLEPDARGFAYLKLSGDELRMVGVMFIVNLITLAIVGVAGGAVAAATYGLWAINPSLSILFGGFAGLAVLVLLTWVWVRLSLAGILTFAEHRIQVRSSWNLTKGRFWPLLGMFLIILLINVGIGFAVTTVSGLIQTAVSIPEMMDAQPQAAAELSGVSPLVVIVGLINFLLQLVAIGLQLVVSYAPLASVYKQLKGESVSAAF